MILTAESEGSNLGRSRPLHPSLKFILSREKLH